MTQSYETTASSATNGEPPRSSRHRSAEPAARHRDRVHWGPVRAGVLVALPVFLDGSGGT